ncbi:MAG: IclR family transcriptional regulator [Firmicutes bacterium]|nr:IclR family transcriptional regulator [Bacillota bacterium]
MSQYTIQSAIKVLDTLFTFTTAEALSLEELGVRTQQSRNQIFRCVKTLEEYGLVCERDGGYALTPLVLKLLPSVRRDPLVAIADPYLRDFQAKTDETVNLVVRWRQWETITLGTYPSRHSVRLVSQIGQVSFLHAGAVPKAILAYATSAEQEAVLEALVHYPQYTPWTISDPERLRAELAATRVRGYSISDQDFEAGGRGVGAPIFDREGKPVAGISVGGPTIRVSDSHLAQWGPAIRDVADHISAELGWVPVALRLKSPN